MADSAVDQLSEAGAEAVVDIFADAFFGYPVMRWTVGEAGDVALRERRLIRLFVERRLARGGPMYAIPATHAEASAETNREYSTGKNFAGAILLTRPGEPESPKVAEISAEAWRELGDEARLRYEEYAAASNFFAAYPPHLHLNMIGVRRAAKGTGFGRVLLEKTRALPDAEPAWQGVSLTTELPGNVEMYRHFGYDVVGEARFGPGIPTWGLYLRLR